MGAMAARRRLAPSILTGLVLGVAGAVAAAWLVSLLQPRHATDVELIAAYSAWAFFFMAGVGALGQPLQWGFGRRELSEDEVHAMAGGGGGVWRYFRFTTDHKVVGIQYLVMVLVLFAVGGIGAFLIRLEQSQPGALYFSRDLYNTIVGMHGTVMIAAVIIMLSGPFGNFVVPIMIGARDMAFPRLNALSFWFLFTAVPVFLTALPLGGFPTGWTGYAPLADQAGPGMDAYCFTILLFAISVALGAINIVATVLTMRTQGMTWGRLPVFVWGVTLSVLLGLVVFPPFMVAQVMVLMDRAFGTGFFLAGLGGSNWLYEQLFWFMGHPEVYVIALPSMAVAADIAAVFARKPVFGYRLIVGGMVGICALSMVVWAHHLYFSGANTALNAGFMLATEAISVPTGVIFLVLVGTLWRGRIWITTPLLFVLGLLGNFVIGGVTGLFLADIPTDGALHGDMFVTAHFHFTLVGGMVFGFFGAFYYWFPKLFARRLNSRLGTLHFWLFEIGFLGTFLSLFAAGLKGEPRWMADIGPQFAGYNAVASAFTVIIVLAMLVFVGNVISAFFIGARAEADEWGAQTLEWTVPTPVPLENFETLPVITGEAHHYGSGRGTTLPAGAAAE